MQSNFRLSAKPLKPVIPDVVEDERFRVEVVNWTEFPQESVYLAMHQDYSEGFVTETDLKEDQCGEVVVKKLLLGNRGHFGPLEHPQITFATGGFPHSLLQQARTHRVSVSFDCQSMRYTGQRIVDYIDGISKDEDPKYHLEDLFYLRPIGKYRDRQGKNYEYSEEWRVHDLLDLHYMATNYADKIKSGFAEEHARGMLPFDYRQNFHVSFNMRSLMHFLDMRSKADAQEEIQQMCVEMMRHFFDWAPEVAAWYYENRFAKARLAP